MLLPLLLEAGAQRLSLPAQLGVSLRGALLHGLRYEETCEKQWNFHEFSIKFVKNHWNSHWNSLKKSKKVIKVAQNRVELFGLQLRAQHGLAVAARQQRTLRLLLKSFGNLPNHSKILWKLCEISMKFDEIWWNSIRNRCPPVFPLASPRPGACAAATAPCRADSAPLSAASQASEEHVTLYNEEITSHPKGL